MKAQHKPFAVRRSLRLVPVLLLIYRRLLMLLQMWSKLLHPNILHKQYSTESMIVTDSRLIEFLGANILDDQPILVMPLIEGGNMRDYMDYHSDCNRLKIVRRSLNSLFTCWSYALDSANRSGNYIPSLSECSAQWPRSRQCTYRRRRKSPPLQLWACMSQGRCIIVAWPPLKWTCYWRARIAWPRIAWGSYVEVAMRYIFFRDDSVQCEAFRAFFSFRRHNLIILVDIYSWNTIWKCGPFTFPQTCREETTSFWSP